VRVAWCIVQNDGLKQGCRVGGFWVESDF